MVEIGLRTRPLERAFGELVDGWIWN